MTKGLAGISVTFVLIAAQSAQAQIYRPSDVPLTKNLADCGAGTPLPHGQSAPDPSAPLFERSHSVIVSARGGGRLLGMLTYDFQAAGKGGCADGWMVDVQGIGVTTLGVGIRAESRIKIFGSPWVPSDVRRRAIRLYVVGGAETGTDSLRSADVDVTRGAVWAGGALSIPLPGIVLPIARSDIWRTRFLPGVVVTTQADHRIADEGGPDNWFLHYGATTSLPLMRPRPGGVVFTWDRARRALPHGDELRYGAAALIALNSSGFSPYFDIGLRRARQAPAKWRTQIAASVGIPLHI